MHRVLDMLPTDCFLKHYVYYASQQVSSHNSYHLGVGLALSGVSAPRNLKMIGFKRVTTPNVYVLITGSSGDAEKTLAIDVGQTLLAEAAPNLIGPDPTADETLVKILASRPNQLFIYPDYAIFLAKTAGGDQRGEGLRNGFMAYYDGLTFDREYSKGPPIHVHDPRPSLLAACTPQHLESYTVALDWQGGSISRKFLFWGERERDIPWPTPLPAERAYLVSHLAWAAGVQTAGESLGLTEEASRLWLSWVTESKKKHAHLYNDDKVRGIISRSRLMAAKASLLVAWSSGMCLEPWRLEAHVLEAGIAIADLHLRSALLLARDIAPNKEMMEQKRLLRAITPEWIAFGDAIKQAELTKRGAAIYIETLIEQGLIASTVQNTTVYYRRTDAGTTPYDYSIEAVAPPPLMN